MRAVTGFDAACLRTAIDVGGTPLSVLRHGEAPPLLLLLHGTFWSRVWAPVMPRLGESLPAAAIDFPGFGCSGGELGVEQASAPALAELVLDIADALGAREFTVAGHDIGGAVAQHLAAHHPDRARGLILVDSVLYDSWPVPAVARFGDPEVRDSTSADEFRDQRRTSLEGALGDRLTEELAADYGELVGERTVQVGAKEFAALVVPQPPPDPPPLAPTPSRPTRSRHLHPSIP
jgi:pimeloyl-ACP methyl ester carboxylesterase